MEGRWRRPLHLLALLAVAGTCLAIAQGVLAPPALATVAPTDLGTLGGTNSTAVDVSGSVVVGLSDTSSAAPDSHHAFAYDLGDRSPSMLDLGTLGGSYSVAAAVDGDIVVGYSATVEGGTHAFVYDLGAESPELLDLGTLGGSYSGATAVDGSIVVGYSYTAGNAEHRAFVYDLEAPSPSMQDLGTLGGSHTNVAAIDGNIIVGWSSLAGDVEVHAFAYDLAAPAPALQDLGTLGGTESQARAVSGNLAVGYSYTAGNAQGHAFVYDLGAASPSMQDLGTLGLNYSQATAVDGGIVVGDSYAEGFKEHAFVYDVGAGSALMRDLGTLGDEESRATAVDGDLVVGYSYTYDGSNLEGHAFAYDLGLASPSMQDLGTLGGTSSRAHTVDGRVVVGIATTAGDAATHAVAWHVSETLPPVVAGTVIDGNRAPLQNICVWIADEAASTLLGVVGTNADGYYELALAPGQRVKVAFSDCGNRTLSTQWFNGSPGGAVTSAAAATATIPATAVNATMYPNTSLTGRITGISGAPLRNICVWVADIQQTKLLGVSGTDADGRYQIDHLPGRATIAVLLTDCGGHGVTDRYDWLTTARDGTPTPWDAVLPMAKHDELSGQVTTTNGAGLGQVCVWAAQAGTNNLLAVVGTGADGRYRIRGLTPGQQVEIAFSDCGGRGLGVEWYDHVATRAEDTPVPVGSAGIDGRLPH